ncbi:hypothetical protein EPA93_03915 [Ktedonosporobacter rubrisoli]|uniref:Uncharacterized protein n=1 Tax=Ktedonosporobacter rubrisoli TaxID=2509675 RepID=A0A4P6JJG9_KTERU|nr:hypothetical protein [Ktedonosporobacter rubrisoli]QBD75183.1 hypothetical protein EPA93_03915 [Ktedonosporobacter rubrisoli]
MSRGNKILVGFVIGALILGAAGLLFAPHLLAMAGVVIGHTTTQTMAINSALLTVKGWSAGVTVATFGNLQAGITALTGLIGGLAGGLIGVKSSKKENNSTLQYTVPSSVASIANEKATGYTPSLDIDGQVVGKSFVKNYEREMLAVSQSPPGQYLY